MQPKSVPSRPQTGWKALTDRRTRRPWLVRTTAAIAIAGLVTNASLGAATAASIVRDAETEALIKAYLVPIFKAAGIRSENRAVFLVPSQSFNAFVADGSKIFVNVGAVITSETPGELIGVLAHEAAHVGNGDLARFKEQLRRAKTATLIAGLLGLGAVAAGGLKSSSYPKSSSIAGGSANRRAGANGSTRSKRMPDRCSVRRVTAEFILSAVPVLAMDDSPLGDRCLRSQESRNEPPA